MIEKSILGEVDIYPWLRRDTSHFDYAGRSAWIKLVFISGDQFRSLSNGLTTLLTFNGHKHISISWISEKLPSGRCS